VSLCLQTAACNFHATFSTPRRRFPEEKRRGRGKLEARGWNPENIGERISLAICIYQRRQSAIAIMTCAFAGDDE